MENFDWVLPVLIAVAVSIAIIIILFVTFSLIVKLYRANSPKAELYGMASFVVLGWSTIVFGYKHFRPALSTDMINRTVFVFVTVILIVIVNVLLSKGIRKE